MLHVDKPTEPLPLDASGPWYKELNRYHWFVFIVAALGWLFDCMDQRIFMVSRRTALTELLGYKYEQGNLVPRDETRRRNAAAVVDASSVGLMKK